MRSYTKVSASSPVAPPRFGIAGRARKDGTLALRTRAQLSRVALQEPGKKRLWRRQLKYRLIVDVSIALIHVIGFCDRIDLWVIKKLEYLEIIYYYNYYLPLLYWARLFES